AGPLVKFAQAQILAVDHSRAQVSLPRGETSRAKHGRPDRAKCHLSPTSSSYASRYRAAMAKKKAKAKPKVCERFGDAGRARREELRMSQEQLAEKAKLHRTYVSDIERGVRNPSLVAIEAVAAGLSTPISELFRRMERAQGEGAETPAAE